MFCAIFNFQTRSSGEETYVRSLNKTELKKWIRSHMMLIEQYRFHGEQLR